MTDPNFDVVAELADIDAGLRKLVNDIIAFRAKHGEEETFAMLLETLTLIPTSEGRQVLLDIAWSLSLPTEAKQQRSPMRLH